MQTTATLPKTSPSVSGILLNQSWTEDYLDIIFNFFFRKLFPFEGLLLLDEAGQLIQSNPKARELCRIFQPGFKSHPSEQLSHCAEVTLPSQLTRHYESLLASQLKLPEQPFRLSEEIFLDTGVRIKLNVERVFLGRHCSPYLLVRLEDMTQTAQQQACWDAHRYRLTQREHEVWTLHLQGLSYQKMSDRLFISRDTVSKHMKSVYSKRRNVL
ncbi:helix-turn-helix transcriptional regulator [Leptothoe spongobia]|uniref:Helix-turn-helix transcriptional regulator n=1 Tax=Leptothoe spongobia TAU-MAC 1115 TaxID=1967444 RepID=A0A947GK63_9CYAN|nr:helix-turn-helix transcriptional regulator [Leptothoe spongobia]MBT9316483.1 helix-turn-helix transcriptional regulator [Leptothoe spongobia TAU-MAC 1115]